MQLIQELARAYLARVLAASPPREAAAGSSFGPSPQEIERVLRPAEAISPSIAEAVARTAARVDEAEAALSRMLADDRAPLSRLAHSFNLSRLDVTLVALLLAPELDHELERAVAFALDDFTRKRPDAAFLARLVAPLDASLRDTALARIDEGAPLLRHRLVTSAGGPDVPRSMRPLRVADRIVAFVRGHDTVDELVRGAVTIMGREPLLEDLVLAPEIIAQVERALDTSFAAPRLLLTGPDGVGRLLLVEAIAARRGQSVVRIGVRELARGGEIQERLAAALREAVLREGIAFVDGQGLDTPRDVLGSVTTLTAGLDIPVVFSLAEPAAWLTDSQPTLVEVALPAPTLAQRRLLWRRALPGNVLDAEALDTVASRYAFTGGVIARSAHRALARARLRDLDAPQLTLDDVAEAARLSFANHLESLAQRIPTGFTWRDLVLPPDTLEGVREVVRFGRQRAFLLEDWGFSQKLPYGRGVSAILAGPPGTGKTMVAQLIARELGFDLYRIDLSQVVNKYIGETEKNLGRIFDLAESSHAVLFFDEADSLFAKRTEVRSSNDRYANLEVNYLLQRMETFDGTTLLATNLEQGIDDAFKRRVRFTVQFELPGAPERERLWQSMFPDEVPLDPGIRWDQLAARYAMAGGYIKKAAIRAALRAADERRPIRHDDLVEAANHEYREMGRII